MPFPIFWLQTSLASSNLNKMCCIFLLASNQQPSLAAQEYIVQIGQRREQRDVQRAMEHWQRNTWASDGIPLLDTFDFSPMKGDWGQRFLICGGSTVETAVFVTYGPGFAKALGLPEKPMTSQPFVEQIPETYRETFVEGYSKVFIEMVPVTLKGTFSVGATFELFRAVFMPIMLQPNWLKQLVFGSFNCRTVGAQ